jgi:hypothetical protein
MTMLRTGLYIALLLILVIPVILAPGSSAQSGNSNTAQSGNSEDIFTISVAEPTPAKDIQIRYFFTGEFGGHGSSVADQIPGNKIVIRTGVEGKSAKTFKAVVYAPGCQFVTITVDDLTPSNRQGDFQCQKLPTIQLHGRVDTARRGEKEWQVEALYVGRWQMSFFGISDGATSPLVLGKTTVAADGSFTMELPNFTADPTWPDVSKDAELMFYLRDSGANGRVALLLTPSHSGNLRVTTSYPDVALEIPYPEM